MPVRKLQIFCLTVLSSNQWSSITFCVSLLSFIIVLQYFVVWLRLDYLFRSFLVLGSRLGGSPVHREEAEILSSPYLFCPIKHYATRGHKGVLSAPVYLILRLWSIVTIVFSINVNITIIIISSSSMLTGLIIFAHCLCASAPTRKIRHVCQFSSLQSFNVKIQIYASSAHVNCLKNSKS